MIGKTIGGAARRAVLLHSMKLFFSHIEAIVKVNSGGKKQVFQCRAGSILCRIEKMGRVAGVGVVKTMFGICVFAGLLLTVVTPGSFAHEGGSHREENQVIHRRAMTEDSKLTVVPNQHGVQVKWSVPTWDVLGFYGSLDTAARQQRWSGALHWLSHPDSLWHFNSEAQCQAGRPLVRSPRGPANQAGDSFSRHYFYVEVSYQCASVTQLSALDMSVFLLFPSLSRIEARVGDAATVVELTPLSSRLPLK